MIRDPFTDGRDRDATSGRDRGVSELVGFIGTFAVIILSVAIITTTGIGALGEFQLHEQHNNAVRNMKVVASDFDELQHGSVMRRSSEIDLSVGRLRWIDDTSMAVETDTDAEFDFEPGSLRLELADTIVAYENGAVVRSDRSDNGFMKRSPRFVCEDGERAVVSIVELDGPERRQVGSGTVRVSGVRQRTDLLYPINRTGTNTTDDPTQVEITVSTSPHKDTWMNYFQRSDNGWTAVDSQTARCTVGERGGVYVRATTINVSFIR